MYVAQTFGKNDFVNHDQLWSAESSLRETITAALNCTFCLVKGLSG